MAKIYKKLKDTNVQILSSLNAYNKYLECVIVLSSHCSPLIEAALFGKACQENDLSIAPMGLTKPKFD